MCSVYSNLIFWAVIFSNFAIHALAGSNTTCAGSMLNWYTDVVGETPCASPCFALLRPRFMLDNRHDLPEVATNLQPRM